MRTITKRTQYKGKIMAMTRSKFEKYAKEIITFADDVKDVIIDYHKGTLTFMRLNQLMSVRIEDDPKSDVIIEYNGGRIPYKTFLAKNLGNLDIMALRIINKDPDQQGLLYVDGEAKLTIEDEERVESGKALSLIEKECTREVYMGSKICFVTADAGHGKTHLLRHYQYTQAERYRNNETDFLFLHIDLHGYDLRKLDEVIMYEMAGKLHIPGIYTNSIITLMRNGLLILGLDGFDELAAETEGEKAIGSFSNLIRSLDGQGVLIAASRRTFFSHDYLKHKDLVSEVSTVSCYFDELHLNNWSKNECLEYLCYHYNKEFAKKEYGEIVDYLGRHGNNPLVERPFLFTNIVSYSYKNNITPSAFLRQDSKNDWGLDIIIRAFIRREVDKWNSNRLDDKTLFLSFEQHVTFLSDIAMEMWVSQRDYISVDVLEFILNISLESWNIPQYLFPDIIKMAKSHALLVSDSHGNEFRRFDHEEFKNYFLAKGMADELEKAYTKDSFSVVKKRLSIAPIPDTVAQYSVFFVNNQLRQPITLKLLNDVKSEYKTTYFQQNLGTFIPYFLDKEVINQELVIDSRIVFSSIIFENKTLTNLSFNNCTFVNISFNKTKLHNVSFHNCSLTDIRFFEDSELEFKNVIIHDDCDIAKVSVYDKNGEPKYEEYAPKDILRRLDLFGIIRDTSFKDKNEGQPFINYDSDYRKAVKRFLNKFIKASHQYEKNIKDDPRYGSRFYQLYIDDIIPLMEEYNIIKSVTSSKVQQASTRAWALKDFDLTNILKAESDPTSPLYDFWRRVNAHE